jgi:protoheme IX farnesyltransferase
MQASAPLSNQAVGSQIRAFWQTIVKLFKLRIVLLLVFSSWGGAALAWLSGANGSFSDLILLTFTGTLAAAGASAINQVLEIERDRQMVRTANRPLVTGQFASPETIWLIGSVLIFSAVYLGGQVRWDLGLWLLLGAIIYVVIYTMWLKPRTLLNIVIGGAAGSCAVMSGGAAFGAWHTPAVWLLALLVFCWTPTHFWALALAYREDYATAGYPMLPTQVSTRTSVFWISVHTVLTIASALGLAFLPSVDIPFFLLLLVPSLILAELNRRLWIAPSRGTAIGLFVGSNLYLTIVLFFILISVLWR